MSNQIKPSEYYSFSSTGVIFYDYNKTEISEPFWGILKCDEEIINYYLWLLLRWGIAVNKGSRSGAHITWNRGEKPPNLSLWGKYEGVEITFRYSNYLWWENGKHVWINVHCPKLDEIRVELGLNPLHRNALHLTIGRLLIPKDKMKVPQEYLYQY